MIKSKFLRTIDVILDFITKILSVRSTIENHQRPNVQYLQTLML